MLTQPFNLVSAPQRLRHLSWVILFLALVTRLKDVTVRDRWKWKDWGTLGTLKCGNKISFVTCVMYCTSTGLGHVNIIRHLDAGEISKSCPEGHGRLEMVSRACFPGHVQTITRSLNTASGRRFSADTTNGINTLSPVR